MAEEVDAPGVLIHPPIALVLAIVAALALNWFVPLPFTPDGFPRIGLGSLLIILALVTILWSARTFRGAKTEVLTSRPASTIVSHGPYRFSRNPIYIAMFLGMAGLALLLNTLWLVVAMLVIFAVLRFGVVAREEAYLERKFGQTYTDYKSRVRRWL